ncbi:MAG TPA: NAD-dependent epimerase/dehydratase family protein [Roseiarcus sp.]|nr:NAD-dependent epimerase/dehydratase family protein [Roseiarcus sp.]
MSRIFLAGAAGVIGRRLTALLLAQGHSVWGATRSPDKSEVLRKLGALPVVVDVFDAEASATAVLEAKPEIVIHQLTDLAAVHDPAERSSALARNARIRQEGTRNLVAVAEGWRASIDRAEHRLGLRAWHSALWRRPPVRACCFWIYA